MINIDLQCLPSQWRKLKNYKMSCVCSGNFPSHLFFYLACAHNVRPPPGKIYEQHGCRFSHRYTPYITLGCAFFSPNTYIRHPPVATSHHKIKPDEVVCSNISDYMTPLTAWVKNCRHDVFYRFFFLALSLNNQK